MLKGSLKRLRYGNGKEWVWRRYAMFCFRLRECLRQPEKHSFCVLALQLRFATQAASAMPFGDEPSPLHCLSYFHFQAAFALLKGSLKRLDYGNAKSGYGDDTSCSILGYAKGWCSLKTQIAFQPASNYLQKFTQPLASYYNSPFPIHNTDINQHD